MRVADVLLVDFDAEMKKTRSYLELVPEDKAAWKPQERSMPLGELAKHLAMLPAFGASFFTTDTMDLGQAQRPAFEFVDRADLFKTFDENCEKVRTALKDASDELVMSDWAYVKAGEVLSAAPRALMYRIMFINHLVHHRAQLGVYLRLLDIKIPGLYGASADETFRPGSKELDKLIGR